MSQLLNAVESSMNLVEYDRSKSIIINNYYNQQPSISFAMERVTIKKDNGELIIGKPIQGITIAYTPGATLQLYNPLTGEAIAGVTFTHDQLFAMLYSMMVSAK